MAPRIDAIGSVDELDSAIGRLDCDIAESIARKFVAKRRDDPRAWRILLSCVERNGNASEAIRLGAEMLAAFPAARDVTSYAAVLFCNHGDHERAWHALSARDGSLDSLGEMTFAQLHLLRDRGRAAPRFSALAARHPNLLEARLGVENAESLGADEARPVGFFLFAEWHRSIQRSISAAAIRRGLPAFMTTTPWLVRALVPDILVVSDTAGLSRVRDQVPGIRVVHTRHGLSDKNYGFFAAGVADFVCVTSAAVADEYVSSGMFDAARFWVTGYPQLDPLFARIKAGDRSAEPRTVLFAPTFSEGLSAGLLLGADAVNRIRGDDASIRVIIRPHPAMRLTAPALMNTWRAQSLGRNVEFNDDPGADIGALMLRAATMVSDISSIALAYLALDRPIVCLDMAEAGKASVNYAPDGLEWRLRKAADVVAPDALAPAVAAALAAPKTKAAERRELRRHIFGTTTDGRAGERIVERILELRRA